MLQKILDLVRLLEHRSCSDAKHGTLTESNAGKVQRKYVFELVVSENTRCVLRRRSYCWAVGGAADRREVNPTPTIGRPIRVMGARMRGGRTREKIAEFVAFAGVYPFGAFVARARVRFAGRPRRFLRLLSASSASSSAASAAAASASSQSSLSTRLTPVERNGRSRSSAAYIDPVLRYVD